MSWVLQKKDFRRHLREIRCPWQEKAERYEYLSDCEAHERISGIWIWKT